MNTVLGILAFIFALGLIILIHEGGHFIFARRVNVLCREYAFGMGPRLLKKKKGETTYSLRLLPIGGFCAIAGEEEELDPLKGKQKARMEIADGVVTKFYPDERVTGYKDIPEFEIIDHDIYDEKETGNLFVTVKNPEGDGEITYPVDPKAMIVIVGDELQIAPYNRCLNSKRKRDRAMIMFAGPMMNFVLAVIVFFFAGLLKGFVNYNSNVVDQVSASSAAEAAGMQKGDALTSLAVDGHVFNIESWSELEEFMSMYSSCTDFSDNSITIGYIHEDSENLRTITPELTVYALSGLGFSLDDEGRVIFGYRYLNDDEQQNYRVNYYDTFGNDAMPLGSVITKVDDVEISSIQTLYNFFMEHKDGSDVTFTVLGGDTYTFTPYTAKLMKTQRSLSGEQIPLAKLYLGLTPEYNHNFFKCFAYAFKRTGQSTTMIMDTLALLFTGKVGVKNLGGIVSIFTYTSSAAKEGFSTLLNWIGLLSVNIGIMNLLPIPALDGGRLVFVAYEAITKKKPSPKVETTLITVTMIILLAFMAFVTVNDILRLI